MASLRYWYYSYESIKFNTPDGQMHAGEWAESPDAEKLVFGKVNDLGDIVRTHTKFGVGLWRTTDDSFDTSGMTEIQIVGQAFRDVIIEVTVDDGNGILVPNKWARTLNFPADHFWVKYPGGRGKPEWIRLENERQVGGRDSRLGEVPIVSEVFIFEETTEAVYREKGTDNTFPSNTRA